jgi:hypothetical protein
VSLQYRGFRCRENAHLRRVEIAPKMGPPIVMIRLDLGHPFTGAIAAQGGKSIDDLMYHALIVASRVVAGIVGAVAFYLAFFLYEDEEGVWQNRIENLWIAVHERARVTNSTSIALLNKTGEFFNKVVKRIFGERSFSIRAIAASISFANVGVFLRFLYVTLRHHPEHDDSLFGILIFTASATAFWLVISLLPLFTRKRWATVVSNVIAISLFVNAAVLTLLWIPNVHENPGGGMYATLTAALILSTVSNLLVIVAVRSIYSRLASSLSVVRMGVSILALIVIALFLVEGPKWIEPDPRDLNSLRVMPYFRDLCGKNLEGLNISTTMLCAAPLFMLIIILLHKIVWPLLSRFIYPIASRKLIRNRGVLISVGTVCVTFALNLEQVGIKGILKLFS